MQQQHAHTQIRRQDKAVSDPKWIEQILQQGQLLSLSMVDEQGAPYLTTLSYGYDDNTIYLHGAAEGKKFSLLTTTNPQVCFQVVLDAELARNDIPCKCSWKYRSVTGFGRVEALQSVEEKNHALQTVMRQYDAPFTPLMMFPDALWIARIRIEHLSGKSSIYPAPR